MKSRVRKIEEEPLDGSKLSTSGAGEMMGGQGQVKSRVRKIEEEPLDGLKRSTSGAGEMGGQVLMGLSIAGVASTLLTTVFGLFHVDVFLRAYELPLPTYSIGSIIFSIINTANDFFGAWLIDHYDATTVSRSDLIGLSGCLFSLFFLTPFFRWWKGSSIWNGPHFVVSLCLYDTLYSFTAILMGSIVSDNHYMSDQSRVRFMASGKAANLIASFVVARVALKLFQIENLYPFRVFLLVLMIFVAALFVAAQGMISSSKRSSSASASCPRLLPRKYHLHDDSDDNNYKQQRGHLRWKQVAMDFMRHKNFRLWIAMEMLLEAQTTFISFFLKTFVDSLILETGAASREACDWLLSMISPLTQVAAIVTYIPIRQLGYKRVYSILFVFNILLSILLLAVADSEKSSWIIIYLCVYPVLTGAVQSAGFHLAQADMVLEMKRMHAIEGRHSEPSLAGLFMGANALLCKPMESILPITAATVLHRYDESKQSLFYLLVVPPLAFSFIQLLVWRHFDLTPKRTARMREELKILKEQHQGSDHHHHHVVDDV